MHRKMLVQQIQLIVDIVCEMGLVVLKYYTWGSDGGEMLATGKKWKSALR